MEKIYYIGERYSQMMRERKQFIEYFIGAFNNLSRGGQLSAVEIKKLLSSVNYMETINLLPDGNINLNPEDNHQMILNLNQLPDDVQFERSREPEIQSLKRKNKAAVLIAALL